MIFGLLINCLITLNCNSQNNFTSVNEHPQSPYATEWQIEAPLLIVSTGLTISQMILKDRSPLNAEYIASLDYKDINGFDRSAVFNNSSKAQKASDYLMYGSMSAPLLLLADKKIRDDWKNVALVTSETFIVGMGITMLTKNLSNRARPILYNTDLPIEERLGPDGLNSFFSGHTSMTALSTFMMAKIIVDYHPDTKLKPLIWSTATFIPLTTGMLRYRAGKHFLTDVFTGFAVGALTGYMIPQIHSSVQKRRNKKQNYTIDHFGNKVMISELFVDSIEF